MLNRFSIISAQLYGKDDEMMMKWWWDCPVSWVSLPVQASPRWSKTREPSRRSAFQHQCAPDLLTCQVKIGKYMAVVLISLANGHSSRIKNDFCESFANPTFIFHGGLMVKSFAKSFAKKKNFRELRKKKLSRSLMLGNLKSLHGPLERLLHGKYMGIPWNMT